MEAPARGTMARITCGDVSIRKWAGEGPARRCWQKAVRARTCAGSMFQPSSGLSSRRRAHDRRESLTARVRGPGQARRGRLGFRDDRSLDQRAPKISEPTRTWVAPKAMAFSKSALMPMLSCSSPSSRGELGEEGEVDAGLLVERRDAHEAGDIELQLVAAEAERDWRSRSAGRRPSAAPRRC